MWKYITKEQCNQFLLSLNLINGDDSLDIIKKIYSISNNIQNNYKIFKIKKRKSGYRTIYEPSYNLKKIQTNILKNILEHKKISKSAKAYYKNAKLIDNAKEHLNKKIILKLDIEDFFQNINFFSVYKSCFGLEYFPLSIGILLTNLCTYNGFVPQGSPTASYISNLILREFDDEINNFCESKNISFTRYSDDMTFSGDFEIHMVIKKVRQELKKIGFNLNNAKIKVISKKNRQVVTGIVVNEKLQTTIDYRNKIRQEIYYINKFGLDSHLSSINYKLDKEIYLNKLLGKINYVLQINPNDEKFNNYKKTVMNLIRKRYI